MSNFDWIYIMYAVTGITAGIFLIRTALKTKIITYYYLMGALVAFLTGLALSYPDWTTNYLPREWGDLISITLVLCGVFIMIRNSKPVFARFPVYLTALPLVGILFYPLVRDAIVIKELLKMTYQGGAIVVSVLIISLNHFLYGDRMWLLAGSITFLMAYILFWFIPIDVFYLINDTARVCFATGMVLSSYGLSIIKTYPNLED